MTYALGNDGAGRSGSNGHPSRERSRALGSCRKGTVRDPVVSVIVERADLHPERCTTPAMLWVAAGVGWLSEVCAPEPPSAAGAAEPIVSGSAKVESHEYAREAV